MSAALLWKSQEPSEALLSLIYKMGILIGIHPIWHLQQIENLLYTGEC